MITSEEFVDEGLSYGSSADKKIFFVHIFRDGSEVETVVTQELIRGDADFC